MNQHIDSFCRCTESSLADAVGRVSRWPDGNISWTITDVPNSLTAEAVQNAAAWGFALWAKAAKLTPRYEPTARLARVLITCRSIDGPGSILAECELPQPGAQRVRLWLDVGEQWLTGLTPAQRGIILAFVMAHELGHALGLGHAGQGTPNLMAPHYDPGFKNLGQWDVSQIVSRYGAAIPAPVPAPTPIPTPSPGGSWVMGLLKTFALKAILWAITWFESEAAKTPDPMDDWVIGFIKNLVTKYLAGGQTMTLPEAIAMIDGEKAGLELMATKLREPAGGSPA